jgi:hypothetical protein
MKTIEIDDATDSLGDYASKLGQNLMILNHDGKPIAALVSIKDMDAETVSLSMNPKFISMIEQSRAGYRAEGGISSAEMRHRLAPKTLGRKPKIAPKKGPK